MTDFSKILDKAKELEVQMKKSQEKIKNIQVEGVSGINSVKVILNGEGEMVKLEISPETIKEEKAIIEDLIVAAYNNAKVQLKSKTSDEISKATSGFGIPGSAETAVFLGVLILHGIEPGQKLLEDHQDLVFTLVVALTVSAVFATLVVLALAKYMALLTRISVHMLIPTVTVIALVGAFALNTEIGDVVIAFIFAFIGYFMIRFNYPRVTFTIAIVLGSITELSFHQSMLISDDQWSIFYTRWLSIFLMGLTVLSLALPTIRRKMKERRIAKEESSK